MKVLFVYHADKAEFLGGSNVLPGRTFACDLILTLSGLMAISTRGPRRVLHFELTGITEAFLVRSSTLYAIEALENKTIHDMDALAASRDEERVLQAVEFAVQAEGGQLERPRIGFRSEAFATEFLIQLRLVTELRG